MFQFLLIGGHKASFLPFALLESFENNLKVWLCFSREKKSITFFFGAGDGKRYQSKKRIWQAFKQNFVNDNLMSLISLQLNILANTLLS